MAIHFKSESGYKFLVIFSALLISLIAAIFSVTGIAALFSGYYLTVAIMMGVLEFGKIVVASFVSRFWDRLSIYLKVYFSIAVLILITITSGGIFGYLSDAYQKTKGNYDIIETQVSLYDKKLQIFNSEKSRYEKQLSDQQTRLDNMYNSDNNNNWTVNQRIKDNETGVNNINNKLNAVNDSISVYESKKALTQAETSKGELGPLKYMAGIFDTDMDTVVKYFIFLLIFVFDPLAILLFISVNSMNRKENLKNVEKDLESVDDDRIFRNTNNDIIKPDILEVENNDGSNDDIDISIPMDKIEDNNDIQIVSDDIGLLSTEIIEDGTIIPDGEHSIGHVEYDRRDETDELGVDEILGFYENPTEQKFEDDGIDDEEWVDRKTKIRQQEDENSLTEFEKAVENTAKVEEKVEEKVTRSSANYKH